MNEAASTVLARPMVFGEVLFDCFTDGTRTLGGAPFNVAWHLTGFGMNPLLISRIGNDDMGAEIIASMRQFGMDHSGIQHDGRARTGEVSVDLRHGQPEFDIFDDRAYDHMEPPQLDGVTPSLVYHGSLALRHDATRAALESLLNRWHAPVFLDVNLRRPWFSRESVSKLLDRARWVKINDAEVDLLHPPGGGLAERAAALMEVHDLERIIVTRGERGAFTLDRSGARIDVAPSTADTVVDTVGAGDAFASVCMLGLLRKWPWREILDRAQQFASILVSRRGAIVNEPRLYESLLHQWT
jgi:fructokinase